MKLDRERRISWFELMAVYCSPSSIVQCWDVCAIYKLFRECLLKWNFHIGINFNILTGMISIVPPVLPTLQFERLRCFSRVMGCDGWIIAGGDR